MSNQDRPSPSYRALPVRDLLAAVFGESKNSNAEIGSKSAPLDIFEAADHYRIDVSLPGFKREEILLEFEDGVLSLTAERDRHVMPTQACCIALRRERYAGAIDRQIRLPAHAQSDLLRATLEDGVLSIVVPKAAAPLPHSVTIN